MTLITVESAERIIREELPTLSSESVGLPEAVGRVLHEQVRAERSHPPFDRATMDGIALASSDFQDGLRVFEIVGIHPAGRPPPVSRGRGTCFEVMTGAVMPKGLDCVVPVELVDMEDGKARLLDEAVAEPGGFVHREGSDRERGAILLQPGRVLHGPEIAVLASEGYSRAEVAARPRVCVIATGDELKTGDEMPAPHQIRSSNAPAMAAAIRCFGWGEAYVCHLPDDKALLQAGLENALLSHDVLVLSGGVSRGRFDYIPDVLSKLGVLTHFHRVRQRPGKPMWFGTRASDGKSVFALPGNPVSSLVCLHRYVLPALLECAGCAGNALHLPLGASLEFKPELTWFVPVVLADGARGTVEAVPRITNTSGDLVALAGTDGFLELPAESTDFPSGFAGRFFSWKP